MNRPSGRTSQHSPRRQLERFTTALFIGVFVFRTASGAPAPSTGEIAPLGRFDYAPYRVSVSIAFTPDPAVNANLQQTVLATLAARIEQTFGPVWNLSQATRTESPGDAHAAGIQLDDRLTPPNETGLARMDEASAAERMKDSACDKAYFLVVRCDGASWRLYGREWDRSLKTLGRVESTATLDRRGIANAALELLQRLYSPLLIIDDADRESKTCRLTVRAGSIPFGDARYAPLKPGALLRPVFRFLDAKRQLRKVQAVPWTYLVIDEIDKGKAKCSVVSSYRAPLAANMRRRVDAVAVLMRVELPQTKLSLVSGRTTRQPAAGVYVMIDPWPPIATATAQADAKGAPPPKAERLLTDRSGCVAIPANAKKPFCSLEVRSGSAILARRPFVSGVDEEVTLELPEDNLRLATERDIDLLRDQLVETVARRAALIGRTRGAANRNDLPEVKQLLAQLDQLPNAQAYLDQVNKIRVLSLEDARRQKNKLAERRIEDLSKTTRELIEQYLPDARLQEFKEEMDDIVKESQAGPREAKPKTTVRGAAETRKQAPARPARGCN